MVVEFRHDLKKNYSVRRELNFAHSRGKNYIYPTTWSSKNSTAEGAIGEGNKEMSLNGKADKQNSTTKGKHKIQINTSRNENIKISLNFLSVSTLTPQSCAGKSRSVALPLCEKEF